MDGEENRTLLPPAGQLRKSVGVLSPCRLPEPRRIVHPDADSQRIFAGRENQRGLEPVLQAGCRARRQCEGATGYRVGIVHHWQSDASRPVHAEGVARGGIWQCTGLYERRAYRLEREKSPGGIGLL